MMVLFTHRCPHCGRRRRLNVRFLGSRVQCIQCGREAVAADPHNESLAMQDCIKQHAELTQLGETAESRIRAPR